MTEIVILASVKSSMHIKKLMMGSSGKMIVAMEPSILDLPKPPHKNRETRQHNKKCEEYSKTR